MCSLARFICSAGARSVPAPPWPAPPAYQRGDPGAAPREPAPPPRGTAGFRTKGEGVLLCLLSPRGLRPSNSRFLKEPRPVRRASSGSRLAAPDRFPGILRFLGPIQSLSWCPDGGFGSLLGGPISCVTQRKMRLREGGGLSQVTHGRRRKEAPGVLTPRLEKQPLIPDATLLSCTAGGSGRGKHTRGEVSLTLHWWWWGGDKATAETGASATYRLCLGAKPPYVPRGDAPNSSDGGT